MYKILFFTICLFCYSKAVAQITDGTKAKAYYPFDGNANDESGNGYHGTVYHATLTQDRFGKANSAYLFNGTSAYIDLGNQVGNGIRTISMWFRLEESIDQNITYPRSLFVRNSAGVDGEIAIIFNSFPGNGIGKLHFGRRIGVTSYIVESNSNTWAPGNWHHLVVTIDNTQGFRMYIDNVLQSASNPSTAPSDVRPENIALGRWGNSAERYFKGALDDVRIFEKSLSPAEVEALFNELPCRGNTPFLTFYKDADADGFGAAAVSLEACTQPQGYVSNSNDCDDSNSSVYPQATELCDGLDNNCNGETDEGVKSIFYADSDGDGYGSPAFSILACSAPIGYKSNKLDCDDANSNIHTTATELCDGIDNNCNGSIDEELTNYTYYADLDEDGFGDLNNTKTSCSRPMSYVENSLDCDDKNQQVGMGTIFYADLDGDGFGNTSTSIKACIQPLGYVANNQDCNDADEKVYPGASELCDGMDNNCNEIVDDLANDVLKLFPNPVESRLHIELECNTGGGELIIYSATGQKLYHAKTDQDQFDLELKNWMNKGIYFVHLYNPAHRLIAVKKIILQ